MEVLVIAVGAWYVLDAIDAWIKAEARIKREEAARRREYKY